MKFLNYELIFNNEAMFFIARAIVLQQLLVCVICKFYPNVNEKQLLNSFVSVS